MEKVIIVCPRCGEKGQVAKSLLGEAVTCEKCHQNFLASQPSFWQRQKQNSPLVQYWWLAPALVVLLAVSLGQMSIALALGIVGVTVLILILQKLTILASKRTKPLPDDPEWDKTEQAFGTAASQKLPLPQ